jgi:hypothetical protein
MARTATWLVVLAALLGCQQGPDSPAGASQTTSSSSEGDPADATAAGSSTSSSGTSSATSDSTECGNGLLEADEQCDGLAVGDVPCPDNCMFVPGTPLWTTVLPSDHNGGGDDRIDALVALPNGDVAAAGRWGVNAEGTSVLVAALDPDGAPRWSLDYDVEPTPFGDHARDIAVLPDSHVVVSGVADDGLFASAFDMAGELSWENRFVPPDAPETYVPGSAAVTDSGVVVLVAGVGIDMDQPGWIVTYDQDGAELSANAFSANPRMPSTLYPWVCSAGGEELWFSGGMFTPGTGPKGAWLGRGDPSGTIADSLVVDVDPGSILDAFTKAAIAPDGAIIVASGTAPDTEALDDVWIGVYEPDLSLRWSTTYSGELGALDTPAAVAADRDGRFYVAVTVGDANDNQAQSREDVVTLSYDADGGLRWADTYSGDGYDGAYSWDRAGAITIDGRGLVIVAGRTMMPAAGGGGGGELRAFVRALAP